MAADGGAVAELFILDNFLARADCMEEVAFVINQVAVAFGNAEVLRSFGNFHLVQRMLFGKILQVLIAQLCWPAID